LTVTVLNDKKKKKIKKTTKKKKRDDDERRGKGKGDKEEDKDKNAKEADTFGHYLDIATVQRKSKQWYIKILLFGIDACIMNAKILMELRTGKTFKTAEFKERLMEQIFRKYKDYKNKNAKNNTPPRMC